MEMTRYNLNCQKAFHRGLQYAQSFGHQFFEVEHVALAMMRSNSIILPANGNYRAKHSLESHLSKTQRIFGKIQPRFGVRLDQALDRIEAKQDGNDPIDEMMLWDGLCQFSTVLKTFLVKEKDLLHSDDPEKDLFQELSSVKPEENLKSASDKEEPSKQASKGIKISKKAQELLDKYTLDFSNLAEQGQLDPVIGREVEVRRVLEVLGRKKKNNPVLVGEAGVGKTAVQDYFFSFDLKPLRPSGSDEEMKLSFM